MASKVIWTGVALSGLGLGYFLPIVLPVGAIVVLVGVVLLWLDK
jgi:hypothetical protein